MPILLGLFAVLLLASLAAGAALFTGTISVAQQEPPRPTPNPQGEGQPAPGNAATQSAPGQAAQQPRPTVTKRETFEDWIYTCFENPTNKEVRCSIAQELSNAETKRSVFLWRIVQDGKGGLAGVWQTPDGILLSRGITLDAGTPKPIAIPFQTCGTGMCQAVANLAPDFLDTLAKAEKATATIYMLDGRAVNLTLSVKGLATGLAELRK